MRASQRKWILGIIIAMGLIFLIWYFFYIFVCIIISAFLSVLGQPIVSFLDKLKYKNFKLPHSLNAFLALIFILAMFSLFFVIFIPILAHQSKYLSEIDITTILSNFQHQILKTEIYLKELGILSENKTIELIIRESFSNFIAKIDFEQFFFKIVNFAGTFFITFISICFITFFFLKDNRLVYNFILLATPDKFQDEVSRILITTKKLVVRYFWGLLIDIFIVMILITLGMSLIGLDNAVLIGFCAGMMNVVPYLGPTIGGIIGVILGMLHTMATDPTQLSWILLIKIIAVFVIVKIIDGTILQTIIHSKSVKAHPLEVFLIILISGYVGGIIGMIVAIPFYTFLRIIAREFFNNWKLIRAITKNLDEY